MATRAPMVVGEWYHCYNRGVDKRLVFENEFDCERFLTLMYTSNGTKNRPLTDMSERNLERILNDTSIDRGEPLVEIGVYSCMPNHIHFLLKEIRDKGIASFMQKLFTSYTMYFNKKRDRTGALFSGAFKSKHIYDDRYLKRAVSYILLNPAEIFEPEWKMGDAILPVLEKKMRSYRYSSLIDFFGSIRSERKIVGNSILDLYDDRPILQEMLADAHSYYNELPKHFR